MLLNEFSIFCANYYNFEYKCATRPHYGFSNSEFKYEVAMRTNAP